MAEVLSQSQIDALLNSALSGDTNLETPAEESQEKKYRKYDFYSPRKFTKDRLKILNGIFENYTRIINSRLNAMLHTTCEIEVDSIEEQRYYEFSNALIEGDVLALSNVNYKEGVDENAPILFYVTRPIMLNIMDRMIGGEGQSGDDLPADYTYTDVELKLYETVIRDFISVLGGSWENYITLDFSYTRTEVNPTLVQLISLDEAVVLVNITLKLPNCEGRFSIVLPGMILANIFAEISKESPVRRQRGEDYSDVIFGSLRESSIEMVAELCHTQITLNDLYRLNVGDVIDLNCSKDTPVQLNIGGRRWFDGKMGVSSQEVAIKIGETYYKPKERDVEADV